MPPHSDRTARHDWADEIVGVPAQTVVASPQLCRSPLQGTVINPGSLKVFWYELTQGAHGKVTRAKGIFDIADGQSIYGDFVAGLPERDFALLNLTRWLEGGQGYSTIAWIPETQGNWALP